MALITPTASILSIAYVRLSVFEKFLMYNDIRIDFWFVFRMELSVEVRRNRWSPTAGIVPEDLFSIRHRKNLCARAAGACSSRRSFIFPKKKIMVLLSTSVEGKFSKYNYKI